MNARFQTLERPITDAQLAEPNLRLRIGAHVLDIGALRIVSRPQAPRLTSKAVAVLIELVRHAGDTVTRDQLLERVWTDRVTTPDVLTQAIKELRRAFVDDTKPPAYIETIPKVGYRLIAAVSLVPGAEPAWAMLPAGVGDAANTQLSGDEFAVATGRAPRRPRHALMIGLALLIAAAAIGVFALSQRGALLHAPAKTVWKAEDLRAVTSDPGPERRPQLAPDATRFAFVKLEHGTVSRVMLRGLQPSPETFLTSKVEGFETSPAWSPDGSEIAFARLGYDTCRLLIMPSTGGSEREVARCQDYSINYFDWSPDATRLITAERIGPNGGDLTLEFIDIASGARMPVTYERVPNDQDLEAHYSPDGKWISFRRGVAPYSDLFVMAASGGAVRQLTHLNARIYGYTWMPGGEGLIFSSIISGAPALYTVTLDGSAPQPLGVSPAQYPNAKRGSNVVLYEIPRIVNALSELTVADVSRPAPLAESTGSDTSPALSPDGAQIAFVSNRSGSQQVWLYDRSVDRAMPVTDFEQGVLQHPNWSADGKRLLITRSQSGRSDLIEIDMATRRQRNINREGENVLAGSFGPEANSYLATIGPSAPEDRLVYIRDAGGSNETRRTLQSAVAHAEYDAQGRWVYYTRTSQRGLFRRALDGSDEQFVSPLITSILVDGWRVTRGKVWYVRDMEFNPTDIRELDPATGQTRSVGKFPIELVDVNFSVSADQQHIVAVPLAHDDTDVGAFKLKRATEN